MLFGNPLFCLLAVFPFIQTVNDRGPVKRNRLGIRCYNAMQIQAGKPASSENTRKGFPAERAAARPTQSATLQWEHGFSKRALLTPLCSHFSVLLTTYGSAAGATTSHHCYTKGIFRYPKSTGSKTTIKVAMAAHPRTNRGVRISL